eukprot:TRINITY_DN11741_c0_g1_i1.p1 TRINITY_DN11741_c0_g1~~TRINITY_DN11741_c0_g1_i1.p1  ORF type:complete len:464 (-),score=111.76 TRINITY_DN11741_c0_g1_i1:196-1587(-)
MNLDDDDLFSDNDLNEFENTQFEFSLTGADPFEMPTNESRGDVRKKLLSEMTKQDWRKFRDELKIFITGIKVPYPIRNWEDQEFPSFICKYLENKGLVQPTPVQSQAIPSMLLNRDVIAISETGGGKTLSFGLPILTKIYQELLNGYSPIISGPLAIIVVPTRELVLQIADVLQEINNNIKIACFFGGQTITRQVKRDASIIVSTTGRLVDLLKLSLLSFANVKYFVLDECDKLVVENFFEDINFILSGFPDHHVTTSLFSATLPKSLIKVTEKLLKNPVRITIGNKMNTAETIEERVKFLSFSKKDMELVECLDEVELPAIIFARTKTNVDRLAKMLRKHKNDLMTLPLHGSKDQKIRAEVIRKMRNRQIDVLVATSLASRGLDIEDVATVINYDVPSSFANYIHQIGRTGRAGRYGLSITFMTKEDCESNDELLAHFRKKNIEIPFEMQEYAEENDEYINY